MFEKFVKHIPQIIVMAILGYCLTCAWVIYCTLNHMPAFLQ
jgi:hypothetical protein